MIAVVGSAHDFGNGNWTQRWFTDEKGTYRNFALNVADEDFIPALKMSLAAGRNFIPANSSSVFRRGSYCKRSVLLKNTVGRTRSAKRFRERISLTMKIIGVVKDFNFASLYTTVRPLAIVENPAYHFTWN